jgi:3-hydroxyacyl-[acyl-carrier-protein] dehydratase
MGLDTPVAHLEEACGAIMTDPRGLNIGAILERLPHRYPMLLIDRVIEIHPGRSIRALKNVTYNEQFFSGHFPLRPLMPGVIVVEALAQAASVLALLSPGPLRREAASLHFMGLEKARFRKPVMPGDQLLLHAHLESDLNEMMRFKAVALVGADQVATAEILLTAQAPA